MGRINPGDDIMTTINCSLNCIYQNDGKCNLDNTKINLVSMNAECVYFSEKVPEFPADVSIAR